MFVLTIIKVFYSPTDAQVNCLKNNIEIYIRIAATCFGAVTPSSGRALFVLAKVTLCLNSQLWYIGTKNALPEDGVTAPKHVRVILL